MAPRKAATGGIVKAPATRRTAAENKALGKTAAAAVRKAPTKRGSAPLAAALTTIAAQPPVGYAPVAPAPFVFSMGQDVVIAATGEEGVVRGRGEFIHSPHQYLLAYRTALGTYAETWIAEDLLRA